MSPIIYLEDALICSERGVASRELRALGDTHLGHPGSRNRGVDSELPSLRSSEILVGGDGAVVLLGNHLFRKVIVDTSIRRRTAPSPRCSGLNGSC